MSFKCLIVGDKGVGKSTYIQRLLDGSFEFKYSPTDELKITSLKFNTTSGPIEFEVYDGGYRSKIDCAIIMFDLAYRPSFEHVIHYYNWIQSMFGTIPIVLCGNKVDMKERKVSPANIGRFLHTKHLGLKYFDMSAKSNYNFEKPFLTWARGFLGDENLHFC